MTTYDVTVVREDELWVADIPALTAATDMFRFADLDVEVRDLVAGLTDADPESFDLRWHHRAGDDDVTDVIEELGQVQFAITNMTTRRDALRREVIRRMSAAGLSQRAIGDVLGLSHQRVNQLANAT
jgi:hypothetical protein